MEGAPMLDTTTFVGLDVHARSIKAVSLDVMTGEVRCATFGYDAGAVAGWVRSNKHLRKALVEAAWHYLTCSARPKDLARGQDPDRGARRHAAKGVRRLVERREALLARGVHGRTSPRRASSPAGYGRSASWPRRRRGAGPPHISRSPRKRFDPKPLRRTSGPFSASAQGATRVHRLSVRRRSLSRSNGLPSERSPRADIKLQRRASVRHAEVAADGLI